MGLTDLIRNITVVAALAVPMYGCEGDEKGGSASDQLKQLCGNICSDYDCAKKVSLPNSNECYNECTNQFGSCSDDMLDHLIYCFNSFACDDSDNLVPCLKPYYSGSFGGC